jgi:predicted Holliday junction resolvase-like endonuclease
VEENLLTIICILIAVVIVTQWIQIKAHAQQAQKLHMELANFHDTFKNLAIAFFDRQANHHETSKELLRVCEEIERSIEIHERHRIKKP